MDIITIFDFLDYKQYLLRKIESAPRKGRGMRSAFAAAANCQNAYMSRVLAAQAELSLEQADGLNILFGHSEPESHYFLLCVQLARAGTNRLRTHFRKQLEELRSKRTVLKERFQIKVMLSLEEQALYYSSWIYAASHMCASIPHLAQKEAMANYLGISVPRISEILDFLIQTGMLAIENGKYRLGTSRIHLGSDSPLVSKHHTNWRIQAIHSMDTKDRARVNADLHYTSIVSIASHDQKQLKALFLKTIDEFNALVAPSVEQEVHCLALDFFKL
jgi:uncharacterized protein (TIGR02147 family)